jgi:hypothetical protein
MTPEAVTTTATATTTTTTTTTAIQVVRLAAPSMPALVSMECADVVVWRRPRGQRRRVLALGNGGAERDG